MKRMRVGNDERDGRESSLRKLDEHNKNINSSLPSLTERLLLVFSWDRSTGKKYKYFAEFVNTPIMPEKHKNKSSIEPAFYRPAIPQ